MIKKISVIIPILCMLLIGSTVAAQSSLDEATQDFYAQNNILFYEPCTNSSGSGICGDNKDYEGNQVWTDEQLEAIRANEPFYEKAASQYNIPWQMIAAMHMREHGLARDNPNGDGPYQMPGVKEMCIREHGANFNTGNLSDEEFQKHTDCAAHYLSNAMGDDVNDDSIKRTFYHYNSGGAGSSAYERQAKDLGFSDEEAKNGEGSPYVMNKYDEKRDPNKNPTGWGQIKTDGGGISYPANQDYGAFVYYKAIADCSGNEGSSNVKSSSDSSSSSNDSSSSAGSDVTIIGDSITEGSKDAILSKLSEADITSQVSKQFTHGTSDNPGGLDILNDYKNQSKIRKKLVFALGTNGSVSQADVDQVFQTAGDSTEVFLVTNWTKNDNYDSNNKLFNATPSSHKNAHVIDWAGTVSADPDKYLGGDGIHPNDEGKEKFAELIANAVNANGYDCNEGGGNSISETTNNLAWPYGTEGGRPQSVKPEFADAAKKVGLEGNIAMDCGKFAAVVIRASGADSNFPESFTGTQLDYLSGSSNWKKVDNNGDESNFMPGDIFVYHNDDGGGHIFIYLGEGKKAEASLNEHYGVVHDLSWDSVPLTTYSVFRLASSSSEKAQTNSGVQCGCVDSNTGGLKDGGFATKEEAEAFLIPKYQADSLVPPLSLVMPDTGDYHHNCVAFSNWFLKDFTTITNGATVMGNGNQTAYNLYNDYHDKFPELKASDTPSVYSIASWTTAKPNTPDGNHTGVIVGINQSTGKILIAEAGFNMPQFTGVHEYDLQTFVGTGSYYVDVNAYLNKGGLK